MNMQYNVIDNIFNCRKQDKEEVLQKVSQKIEISLPVLLFFPNQNAVNSVTTSLLKTFLSLRCQNNLVPRFSHINIQCCLFNTFPSLKECPAQKNDDPHPPLHFCIAFLNNFPFVQFVPNIKF